MIDTAALKLAAAGKWPEILPTLTPIKAESLDGRHHPCPLCGGKDRFRMIDRQAGAVLCNQCFNEDNGNGLSALKHYAGVDISTAAQMLADYLGMSTNDNGKAHGANGAPKKAADEATLTKDIESINPVNRAALLETYCKAKPPITPEGIRKCGGAVVAWKNYECLQIDGYQTTADDSPTAVVLLRIDGKPFPAFGPIGERKSHTTKGSVNSWISSGDVATADTILDLEGITDLLAATSAGLPSGWVAVTNTAGAKARGTLPRPWAQNKRVIVAGDADEPGQDGKHRSAAAYHQAGASEVLDVQLPYQIEKDHGKDIRDWLREGHAVADLPTAPTKAEDFQGNAAPAAPDSAFAGKPHGPVPISVRADSITTRPIRWLTPQFPLGKYSTIVGHPGLGKSLLTTDLAARVSIGAPGPGSDETHDPGDVIMIQNEDDHEDTVVPRLIAAGADLSRVHFLTGIAAADETGIRPFTLEDVWAIESLLSTLQSPRLVTIDPVGSYCGKANAHYDSEVRGLLMPLADLARRLDIAIIGNAHFNKGGGKAIDKGMGSIAWVAAARAAWGVVRDTENPLNRLFLPIKCNLAKDNAGLSFQIVDGDGAPRLAWSPTAETRNIDDILAAQPTKRSPQTDEAIEWLKDFLAMGAAAQRTIEQSGKDAGHLLRTLNRAKAVLKVKSFFDGHSKTWFWQLPEGGEDAEF